MYKANIPLERELILHIILIMTLRLFLREERERLEEAEGDLQNTLKLSFQMTQMKICKLILMLSLVDQIFWTLHMAPPSNSRFLNSAIPMRTIKKRFPLVKLIFSRAYWKSVLNNLCFEERLWLVYDSNCYCS